LVAPGADPSCIRWRYVGVDAVSLDPAGALVNSSGEVLETAPVAWQDAGGGRAFVDVRFDLSADGAVDFVLGRWDASRELVIDPEIAYATFLGGSAPDGASGIAVDAAGFIYVAGVTDGGTFPSVNAHQESMTGGDAFIVKIAQSEVPLPPALFHRADPNASGTTDLSDGVAIFAFLVLGAPGPGCVESADTGVPGSPGDMGCDAYPFCSG